VHGLIGENGAGKSTLVKILSGMLRADSGAVFIHGEQVSHRRPDDAFRSGLATAFQESTLVGDLTVAQNLLLHREPRNSVGLVSRQRLIELARSMLVEWQAEDIDLLRVVSSLPLAVQQRIEIVKALARHRSILILDEPTSALGPDGVAWLKQQIARVRERASTVVFISHRLFEISDMCDRITVLRNGRDVGCFPAGEISSGAVLGLMLGRALEEEHATRIRRDREVSEPVLAAVNLELKPDLHEVTLELRRGEILGVAGLQGHGQKSLFMALFGAHRPDKGEIEVGGKRVRFHSPRDAIREGLGISLVPEDRKTEGLLLDMSVRSNMSIACVRRFSSWGWLSRDRERAAVEKVMSELNINAERLDADITSLSGGNQQKVILGRWLLADTKVLLLYDPTRGVDVGVKADLFEWMRQFVSQGGSILFYSSDIPELISLCDRVVVFHLGRIQTELAGQQLSQESVLSAMLGEGDGS
jgi:ribose transport system ATP-binding protein